MVRVKICGITNLEDARLCADKGADALGFIFYRNSPRYIPPEKARKIIKDIGPFVNFVGIFKDADKDEVRKIIEYVPLDTLQFHGKESRGYCNLFSRRHKIVKVFFPSDVNNDEYILKYNVDAYMFDLPWEEKIKGRKVIDNEFLSKIAAFKKRNNIKIIISGGLTPHNVKRFIRKIKPYAVDVASGVEEFIGKKDKEKISSFIQEVKS